MKNASFFLLLVCFFLSGFSALLYETAWTREFAFVFGTSELAVVAVLAAYMGGLALGAAVAARWAPRIRRPVLVYGVLELAIALWALALPAAVRGVRAVYLGWLGGLDALPETLGLATHAFHLIGAFVVLVPCTALMGATLPLLARHAVTRDDQIGPRVGLLYGVNTAGAIAGTLAAAFVLLPALGLRHTVYVGAAFNALVFVAAAALARSDAAQPAAAASRVAGLPWILPAICVSGAVSFGYEVLWFRMLGHILGGSTAAFSTMLASFLTGIALGSALASRFARRREAAATGFEIAQLATALTARVGFAAADQMPMWAAALGASVNALGPGAILAMAGLLPLTLCIGATFPFAVRLLARDAAEASASSARVYAWNTVGSIAGAVGTGYALLPWIGLENTLATGVALSLGLAVAAGLLERPARRAVVGLAVAGALALALLPPARPDHVIRTSPLGGIYDGEFGYLSIGRSSTVALIDRGLSWRLTTNGLPESVIAPSEYPSETMAAHWLSLLPALLRPDLSHMVIIGLGGGMTLDSVPPAVDRVDVIELEPEVVTANRVAREGDPRDPLSDPRLALRLSDARGALLLAEHRYGAIVSQPSHPWTSGASHLYTREFFALARSRLEDDGVFVQWIGARFVDPERLRSLVRALNEVFANVAIFRIEGAALVMVSSDAPFDVVGAPREALAADPEAYRARGVFSAEQVAVHLVLDPEASRAYSAGAQPNTDDFNLLATSGRPAPPTDPRWLATDLGTRDPLPGLLDRLDTAVAARALQASGHAGRVRTLAGPLAPAQRELLLGWAAFEAQRTVAARRHLKAALARDPLLDDAAIGLALLGEEVDAQRIPEPARSVVRLHRLEGGFEAVREVDDVLAAVAPSSLLHPEATELRARWRAALGDEEELREASALISALIARQALPRNVLLYAQIMQQLGRADVAWMALDALPATFAGRSSKTLIRRALELARELGPPPDERIVRALREAAQGSRRGADRRAPTGS